MMRFINSLIVSVLLIGSSVMANEVPVKISVQNDYNPWTQQYDQPTAYITAISDNLVINDILVNKGHCKISWKKDFFPFKLAYSKQIKFPIKCNLIRIDVKTNQDDWSVEY